jgi:hypothetical protein
MWLSVSADAFAWHDTGCVAELYSRANGKVVSAELGYDYGDPRYGMLRARADWQHGEWEVFKVWSPDPWDNADGWYALQAANGKFVSAEIGWDYFWNWGMYGMLRARADWIGTWEQFAFRAWPSPYYRAWVVARANDKIVSVELEYPDSDWAMLRARADEVYGWELIDALWSSGWNPNCGD